MPVSHIGLTVTHLPTSCSFFLAALQPLGYRYIGQEGNQVGLGISEADFFLCQETPGLKAGAAHIAFSAPSRSAVRDFYAAALNAGGRPHGSPALRNEESGCFNAAILDFDGNSIEVVHSEAPQQPDDTRSVASQSRVLTWQKSVVKGLGDSRSVVSAATIKPPTAVAVQKTRSVVSAAPPAVARSVSAPVVSTQAQRSDDSAKRLVGTLLGAAAGAAVAYAMCKGDEESKQPAQIEAAPRSVKAESVHSPPQQFAAIAAPPSYRAIEAGPAPSATGVQSYHQPSYHQPSYQTVVSAAQKAIEYIPAASAAASAVLSPPSVSRSVSSPSVIASQRGSSVHHQQAIAYSVPPSAAGIPLPGSAATSTHSNSIYHSAKNSTATHSYVSARTHTQPPPSAASLARSAAAAPSRVGSQAGTSILGRDHQAYVSDPSQLLSVVDVTDEYDAYHAVAPDSDSDTVGPDDSISIAGSQPRSHRSRRSKAPSSAAPSSSHKKHHSSSASAASTAKHSHHSKKSSSSSSRRKSSGRDSDAPEHIEDVRAPSSPSDAGSDRSARRRKSGGGSGGEKKERRERKSGGGSGASAASLPIRAITESMIGIGRKSGGGRSVATYAG